MPDDIDQHTGLSEESVRNSYDRVADEYTRRVANELDGKPFDRELLDRVAGDLRGAGAVCDMGCGPGHVGLYMAARGAEVVGLDLSPGMIAEARRRNPTIGYWRATLDFVLHPTARVVAAFQAAGFGDVSATERDPYPDVEYPSRRAYVEAVRA